MSKPITFIELSPPQQSLDPTGKQKIAVWGFKCPTCNGRGGFDRTGYNSKWKDQPNNPDFKECTQCNGSGLLKAEVLIFWTPEIDDETKTDHGTTKT